jgi:hypothetical protein
VYSQFSRSLPAGGTGRQESFRRRIDLDIRGKDRLRRAGETTLIRSLTSVFFLLITAPALAQSDSFQYEIAPFASYRSGGSFNAKDGEGRIELNDSSAAGIVFNIEANPNGQYELVYARQRTDADTSGFFANDPTIDMDVEYLQFGGTYLFDGDAVRSFIALTLGATRFDPELAGTRSESFFSGSFGGGLQIRARERLGVRLEARVYTTFIDDDSKIFCSSIDGVGGCLIQVDARTLSQWEARVGLVFRF